MAGELFLQVEVISAIDQAQNKVRAPQFGVAIVTKQQDIISFLVHSLSSKAAGSGRAPPLYHVRGALAMPPTPDQTETETGKQIEIETETAQSPPSLSLSPFSVWITR